MAVRDVPSALAYAAVSCKFVPWGTLRDLKNATEQVHHSQPCASYENVLMTRRHNQQPHLKDITADDNASALQYVGKVTKGNSSHALASLMNIISSAETSSAQQIVLVSPCISSLKLQPLSLHWSFKCLASPSRAEAWSMSALHPVLLHGISP